jgi:hypothetical protein
MMYAALIPEATNIPPTRRLASPTVVAVAEAIATTTRKSRNPFNANKPPRCGSTTTAGASGAGATAIAEAGKVGKAPESAAPQEEQNRTAA